MTDFKVKTEYNKASALVVYYNLFSVNANLNKKSRVELLCVLSLLKYMSKLKKLADELGGNGRKKISMNGSEALAFHVLYTEGRLNLTSPFVNEVFTQIDRQLRS